MNRVSVVESSRIWFMNTEFIQVAYLSPEGDPLWFTLGKASNDLIPTGALLHIVV
jgi:hypothetical protein